MNTRPPFRACLPRIVVAALLVVVLETPLEAQPGLSFEDRVAAQEAIERVHYAHQVGAIRPFAAAVPKQLLESKVRAYLERSAALSDFWQSPISVRMLEAELTRVAWDTRLPSRLLEIYAALGNDPVLVQECFIRPLLAERLTRSFFAQDRRIHLAARTEADRLRDRIVRGELAADALHPNRSVTTLFHNVGERGALAGC